MDKPNVMLLHGALGAKDQFGALAPLLDGKVHTLDFEGHGHAPPKDRPFDTNFFVENILGYMDEHQLRVVDVFGYSMGGHVGLCLARQHPERVRRIFTFATKFNWSPETSDREAAYLDPDRIAKKAPEFARTLAARHTGSGWEAVLSKTREMTLRQGRERLLTESDYAEISQPTRLSMGDRDKMVSIEETINIYRLLPKAQLQVFPATPHPIELVSMEMLAAAITSFFNG